MQAGNHTEFEVCNNDRNNEQLKENDITQQMDYKISPLKQDDNEKGTDVHNNVRMSVQFCNKLGFQVKHPGNESVQNIRSQTDNYQFEKKLILVIEYQLKLFQERQ